MRRKYFLAILFLILAIFLSGCGIVTPATDDVKVKSVIQDFFLAINDQDWSKAKNCCIYCSDAYYTVFYLEDAVNTLQQYYGIVTITCFANISNVSIYGNYANAYVNVTVVITAGHYYESSSDSGYLYLQKIGNSWKLY